MSSVGDCFDQALSETCFATLECELLNRTSFKTVAQARMAVFQFIDSIILIAAIPPATASHRWIMNAITLPHPRTIDPRLPRRRPQAAGKIEHHVIEANCSGESSNHLPSPNLSIETGGPRVMPYATLRIKISLYHWFCARKNRQPCFFLNVQHQLRLGSPNRHWHA